jgi:hypothetical protein
LNPDAVSHYIFQSFNYCRRITFVLLHPLNDLANLRYNVGQFLNLGFFLLKGPHFTGYIALSARGNGHTNQAGHAE